jgi:enoyl-CoA hydratase/carnithine racemase
VPGPEGSGLDDLGEAIERALLEPAIAGLLVVVSGDPPLDERAGAARTLDLARRGQGILDRLHRGGKPAVAVVVGEARAAGAELALACHAIVCAAGARIAPCQLAAGELPRLGGMQRLARRVGAERALRLLLAAEPVPADEALALGLVDQVAPDEQVRSRGLGLLARLTAHPASLVATAIEAVTAGCDLGLDDALELDAQLAGLVAARRSGG